jgi:hypothetical protein
MTEGAEVAVGVGLLAGPAEPMDCDLERDDMVDVDRRLIAAAAGWMRGEELRASFAPGPVVSTLGGAASLLFVGLSMSGTQPPTMGRSTGTPRGPTPGAQEFRHAAPLEAVRRYTSIETAGRTWLLRMRAREVRCPADYDALRLDATECNGPSGS